MYLDYLASNREAVNNNVKVIGFTRLEIQSESIAPEADALATRPSNRAVQVAE